MIIIETVSEFNSFLEEAVSYDWIVVPTFCNGTRPVYVDDISVVYIYVLNLDRECMMVFNHTEGLNLPKELIYKFPKANNIFVYNKKRFMKTLNRDNLIDMSMVEYFHNNQSIEDDFKLQLMNFFIGIFERFIIFIQLFQIIKILKKVNLYLIDFLIYFIFIIMTKHLKSIKV